jgi:hypothetical protein
VSSAIIHVIRIGHWGKDNDRCIKAALNCRPRYKNGIKAPGIGSGFARLTSMQVTSQPAPDSGVFAEAQSRCLHSPASTSRLKSTTHPLDAVGKTLTLNLLNLDTGAQSTMERAVNLKKRLETSHDLGGGLGSSIGALCRLSRYRMARSCWLRILSACPMLHLTRSSVRANS